MVASASGSSTGGPATTSDRRPPLSAQSSPAGGAPHRSRHLVAAAICAALAVAAEAPLSEKGAIAEPTVQAVAVPRGGTLEGVLLAEGVSLGEAAEAVRAIQRLFDPRDLMPGQRLELRLTTDNPPRLLRVRLQLDDTAGIQAVAAGDGSFAATAYDSSADQWKTAAEGPLLWVQSDITGRTLAVRNGDTLMTVSLALGAHRIESDAAIQALSRLFNPRRLQIGQAVTALFGENGQLLSLAVAVGNDLEPAAVLTESGEFRAQQTPPASRNPIAARAEPLHETVSTRLGRGDSVLEVAMRLGADLDEAFGASQALSSIYNLRRLAVGQVVTAVLGKRPRDENRRLLWLSVSIDNGKEVAALLEDDGGFEAMRTTPVERADILAPIIAEPTPAEQPGVRSTPAMAQVVSGAIGKGDTLLEVAIRLGAGVREALRASQALDSIYSLRRLAVGQDVTAMIGVRAHGENRRLLWLSISIEDGAEAAALLADNGKFEALRTTREERVQRLAALATPAPDTRTDNTGALALLPQQPDVGFGELAAAPAGERADVAPSVGTETLSRTLGKGDTLLETATLLGADLGDAFAASKSLDSIYSLRRLSVGQVVTAVFGRRTPDEVRRLLSLSVSIEDGAEAAALLADNGRFEPFRTTPQERGQMVAAMATPAPTVPADGGALALLPRQPDVGFGEPEATPANEQADATPPVGEALSHTLGEGDTLLEVATRLGADVGDAFAASTSLDSIYSLRRLSVGQVVTAVFGHRRPDEARRLLSLSVSVEDGVEAAALLAEDGGFDPFRITPQERAQRLATAAPAAPAAAALPQSRPPADVAVPVANEILSRTLREGNTLLEVATLLGADIGDALTAGEALDSIYSLQRLAVGQVVTAVFGSRRPGENRRMLALSISIDDGTEAVALLEDDGGFHALRASPEERAQLLARLTLGPGEPLSNDMPPRTDPAGGEVVAEGEQPNDPPALPVAVAAAPAIDAETVSGTLGKGDTLLEIAVRLGANTGQALRASNALDSVHSLRRLGVGDVVTAVLGRRTPSENRRLLALSVFIDDVTEAAALLTPDGGFQALRTTPDERATLVARLATAPGEPLSDRSPANDRPAPAAPIGTVPGLAAETVYGTLGKGDTLLEVAMRLGAKTGEALRASDALDSIHSLRSLAVGNVVTAVLGSRAPGESRRLLALSVFIGEGSEAAALLADDGGFHGLRTTPAERARMLAGLTATVAEDAEPGPRWAGHDTTSRTLIVRRGDTLVDAAVELGAGIQEAFDATEAIADIFNPRRLSVGQAVTATFGRPSESDNPRLMALSVAVDQTWEALAFLSESGGYTPRRLSKDDAEQLIAALGTPQRPADDPARPQMPAQPEFDWVATIDRTIAVQRGDTLMEAVVAAGATANDAYEAVQALSKVFDPRSLRAGTSIRATFAQGSGTWNDRLLAVNIGVDVDRDVAALRAQDGEFSPREILKPLDLRMTRVRGVIDDSLYVSAERVGLPPNVLVELIRVYSWDVDFQRDIHTGDEFEVYFELLHNQSGDAVKEGNILYTAMTLSGTVRAFYRHETADGIIDYYDPDGHSARKALLRTPVDGARLSSRYGMRRHPVLGYSRMHRGVDFAAPQGTPIKAAGDGVVEVAGTLAGYGNYVRIRHNGVYQTAYAHLRGYATGIRTGARVRQGQTIGYVGSTGLATGPHLHFEVLENGTAVNPESAQLPIGKRLSGGELAEFNRARGVIDAERAATPELLLVAAAE